MTAPELKRRWFHPTPGKLLIVLLAMEGILFLSNWFHWIPKGWAVLIAIAAVGLFLIVMLLWFVFALIFRWRFQFSLRSLLALTLAAAIPASWLAVEMKKAREQGEAINKIEREDFGAWIQYDYERDQSGGVLINATPTAPEWLRNLLGDDFFVSVLVISLGQAELLDEEMEPLESLTSLQQLELYDNHVTDKGLKYFKGLRNLRRLNLTHTKVTDKGVQELQQALPNCKIER